MTTPAHLRREMDTTYVYLISIAAALGTFLFGYNITVMEGGIIFVQKYFALPPAQLGFCASALYIGAILGSAIFSFAGDWLGRKKILFLAALLYAAGALGTGLAPTILVFDVFRIISGLGLGLASVGVPMYIVEVSPARMRGTLGCFSTFAIVVGAAVCIIVCYYLSFTGDWRWMFGSAIVPAIVFLVALIFIPESPRWLAQKSREREAYRVLARINGAETAELEAQSIRGELVRETGGWSELFRPGIRMAMIIALGLVFFQQAAGPGLTIVYAPVIFQKAGFSKATDAIFQTVLVNLWQVLLTVPAVLFVDRAGRRPLLIIGSAGVAVSEICLGAFLYYNANGKFVLIAFLLALGFFAFSLAPIVFLMVSEIFPTRVRAKGQAIALVAAGIGSFVIVQAFAPLMAYFNRAYGSIAGGFWVFGFLSILSLFFCWRWVPETKGKSLEEIARMWLH